MQPKLAEDRRETQTLSIPTGAWWRLALVGAFAFALVFGLVFLMARIFVPLAMFLFAVVIAEALTPVIKWLQRWMPRGAAIVVVYVGLVLITGAFAWLIIPPVVRQITQGVAQLPDQIDHFEAYVTLRTGISTNQIASGATTLLGHVATQMSTLPIRIVHDLFDVLLVYFLSIYWLFVTPSLKRFVLSLFPPAKRETVADVLAEMGHDMGGYLRGSVISGAITGALAFGGLLLIHVKYALALGFLTFFGELVPVIGVIAVGALVAVVALFQSFTSALFAVAVYTVILFLESHLIAPNIMRRQTTVSQVVVLFALVAGFEVGGILGALVAIPLSAGVRILMIRVFAPGIRKWSGADLHPEMDQGSPDGRMERRLAWETAFRNRTATAFITRVIHSRTTSEERIKPEETT